MATLAHVNIRTPHFDQTVAFYRDVMGFSAHSAATRPDSAVHAWMNDAAGRPIVHIQAERGDDRVPDPPSPSYHHIAFDCTDQDRWRAHLAALDIPYTVTDFPTAGLVQYNLFDPNGLRLELTFAAAA